MKIRQYCYRAAPDETAMNSALNEIDPTLLIVFAAVDHLEQPNFLPALRSRFPNSEIIGCSTAGEITAEGVDDGGCAINAIEFSRCTVRTARTQLAAMTDSRAAGQRVAQTLNRPDLRAILTFGPGVAINGSALVEGMTDIVGTRIPITGGLAGDGGKFQRTLTVGTEGISDDHVVAVGLYGEHLRFGHGSFGGWETFGPARKVTRCEGNILFELDGEPALAIYKRYLGDHAKDLPASGLLFPFAMLGDNQHDVGLIRTILAVDDVAGSLTLAGEIKAGGNLKLMHASTDKLVNGAETAAEAAAAMLNGPGDHLAILVSCVGRKLVMGNRVDEEVEAVADVLGKRACLTGFYSYGEISPFAAGAACQLHNQTMTITCLGED
jgi:hypothetical protein